MKKPWKSTSNAGGGARPRTGPHTIRGRISGPVPIPSPMDDEFPIRNPGTNIATPVNAEFQDSTPESALVGRGQQFAAPPPAQSPLNNSVFPIDEDVNTVQPIYSPSIGRRVSPSQRINSSNPIRHSIVSADAIQIKDKDRPLRKQSKLRGAIGKLLGRKRKQNPYDSPNHTDSDVGSTPSNRPSDYRPIDGKESRQNDPMSLNRPDPRARTRPFPGAESKRSASLPITEFDRALRSHSVRPEDVRAIESARNSLSADFGLSPRRLTSPLKSREGDLTGLSPRPASSQGRDSRAAQHDDDPGEIGRAITSDYMGSRRRSRSLSGLPEVEEDQSKARRRSDEIRYWRESYDPAFMSPVSSDALDGEEDVTTENEQTPKILEDPPQPPPEPFQFDTFANMSGIGGMRITQAADLKTRVCNLESRVHQLEQALDQVYNGIPAFGSQPTFPPRSDPATATAIPTEEKKFLYQVAEPQISSMDRTTDDDFERSSYLRRRQDLPNGFLEDPPKTARNALPVPQTSDRPTSIATIRGVSSLPTLSKDAVGSFTMDHYATLLALVHTERSAREALEAQVKRLGYQVSILSKSAVMRRETQYDPPPTAKSFGDRSAFDHDDDDNDAEMAKLIDAQARSIDAEDSGIGTGHGDESEYSEVYETPLEEGYNFGAFGEDLQEDQHRKAARTLSLSQMTRNNPAVSQHLPHAI